ncbi:MAG: hypothetical protein P1U81_01030 [Verrucomicrobiales bacterium]|nr:hypothetical protein [Verrucomicrobiales bacterium]
MTEPLAIVLWTLLAGAAMPLGAVLARFEQIKPRWLENEFRHFVIAFGGGALLSAVALVLVPEGIADLSIPAVAFWFLLGGVTFFGLDVLLASRKTQAAQLVAMLADFIPEAIALGAAFGSGSPVGPLLAVLIALQNLPEGFNSYREVSASGSLRPLHILITFSALALLGPVCGLGGYFFLADFPTAISGLMLFSAGGILYLIFQDIAPQAKLERHWSPPLGAVAGFLLGLIAHLVVNS